MPHVDIKYCPKNLSEIEKEDMAIEICDVLKKYLGTTDNSISIALKEIPTERWKDEVYTPIIKNEMERLIKIPGYSM